MTRRKVVLLLFVVCLTILALLFHRFLPREAIVAQEHRLRGAIEENPLATWLIGLAIYSAASLIPGTGGKAIICGWLFGLWPAVLMVDVALTAAALLTFSVSRFVFRHTVESRFQHNIARINRGLEREGAFYLLMLRLFHVPYTLVNYACGATRVDIRTFWWTTHLGLLPGIFALVLAGSRIPTLGDLLAKGPLSLLDPWLVTGLVLSAALPLAARFSIRRWKQGVTGDRAPETGPDGRSGESAGRRER